MGYRIIYGAPSRWETARPTKGRFICCFLIFFLFFCFSTGFLYPEKWIAASDFLTPGDPEVTKSAYREFASQLKEGGSLSEAAAVFCQIIVDGAALTD